MRFASFLFLLAAFAGCGIPEEQYNAKLTEIEKLSADLKATSAERDQLSASFADLRAESETLRGRLTDLGEDVQKLVGEKGKLATDLKRTKEREANLRAEQVAQQARLAKYRAVVAKFKQMVSSGKLKIRIAHGQMVVEMSSNILFPSGQANLRDEGKAALGQLAEILKTISDRAFQVAGHTDNVPVTPNGRFKSNWELSAARAVSVVNFLQSVGVDARNLSAAGYGEFRPIADNATEPGKAANRRIEVVMMPSLDELPDLSQIEGELDK